jgi:hypothetical protein
MNIQKMISTKTTASLAALSVVAAAAAAGVVIPAAFAANAIYWLRFPHGLQHTLA